MSTLDGPLETQMDSALRPRDIQARIRAGESPETVAAAAKTTVDKITAFAAPVLAERAHVAQIAQRSSVRRKPGESPSGVLGDAVAQQLGARNIDPETVAWDAWRRADGRWTLVADYLFGESSTHAEFVYDAPGRYVIAEDDEARRLVGEQSAPMVPQPRGEDGSRRLAAVPAENELLLGVDAIDMVSDSHEESTEDLTEVASAVREASPPPGSPQARPAKKSAKKTRGRASVPSWDEIMFGGERRE